MDIDWISHKQISQDTIVTLKLKDMLRICNGIIGTVRKISSDLRPAIIDNLGLIAALEWKCNDFEEKMGIPCYFVSNVTERKFENIFCINTYRILQETLTNISRHAVANFVSVSINENGKELFLEITDDGKGINNKVINSRNALGILGMKERAALLGGKLKITGVTNKGTHIKLTIPFLK
jgi:signal transduction histidine kinase